MYGCIASNLSSIFIWISAACTSFACLVIITDLLVNLFFYRSYSCFWYWRRQFVFQRNVSKFKILSDVHCTCLIALWCITLQQVSYIHLWVSRGWCCVMLSEITWFTTVGAIKKYIFPVYFARKNSLGVVNWCGLLPASTLLRGLLFLGKQSASIFTSSAFLTILS